MKAVSMIGVGAAAALLWVAPAFAQDVEREPFSRSYVSVLAGGTLGDDATVMIAGEYGERITSHVQAFANVSYLDDLMSARMQHNLTAASLLLSSTTRAPWHFSGRDRGIALTLGAKFLPLSRGAFRPYLGAGFGALNLNRTVTEESLGDVTASFGEEFGVSDGNIDVTDTSATKPLGEAVAGVNVVTGRTYVDVNYRYRKAFHSAEAIEFSQLSVGVGIRF